MAARTSGWLSIASFGYLMLGLSSSMAQDMPAHQPAVPVQAGITVEARGPVHEAFAEPVTQRPQPGLVVPKQPPAPIPEQPPDVKPEGDHVVWIPGYWAWDTNKSDFLWVSGFWRNVPPDRRWVPGYWAQVANGWQWVSGFWADAGQQDLSYLPEPPASIENGPDNPAPNDNCTYVPGNWIYRDSGYVWQPGYWLNALADWIWTPSRYCWTPSGYVFNSGYWDYSLANRGCLFAPVSFGQPLWTNPAWFYTPQYTVDLSGLLSSLWVQPAYCHYFFGNYYGDGFAALGLRPWLAFGRQYHDPLFNHYNWAGGRNWFRNMNSLFVGRQNGTLVRPPATLAMQSRLFQNAGIGNRKDLTMVQHFNAANANLRFGRLDQSQVQQHRLNAQHIMGLRNNRAQAESVSNNRRRVPGTAGNSFRLPPAVGHHLQGGAPRHPGGIPATPPNARPHTGPAGGARPVPLARPAEIGPHTPSLPSHSIQAPSHPTPHAPAPAPHVAPPHPTPHVPARSMPPHPTAAPQHAAPPRPQPPAHPVAHPTPHAVAHPAPHPAPHHR